jgi:hypothetical protein
VLGLDAWSNSAALNEALASFTTAGANLFAEAAARELSRTLAAAPHPRA